MTDQAWTDEYLHSIVTNNGETALESTFVVSDDGKVGSFWPSYWDSREDGVEAYDYNIEDKALARAVADYLIRCGRPHYRAMSEVVAVYRELNQHRKSPRS